jgi:type I restriction enzyme S subunit
MVDQYLICSKGVGTIQRNLYWPHLKRVGVVVPPPDEQAAIVRFLDWANGRLERAIRAKRKVIALLNEQKQAIIHCAVTRGLDPSVPLKPSGIPWLGEIPEHWEVSRVKNQFRCLNTKRIPLNAVERGAMTTRAFDYYGASGVIDKVDDYLFDDELLLIAEDGANLVLRNLPLAIIARGRFWVNNHAHILKPLRGNIVYLAHVLETLNYKPWISGAAQPKLTQDRLMAISVAIAPPEEQDLIVEHTTEHTRPLNSAISRLEREIALLREYRNRLVADVVTGKLDVREAATRLPDEELLPDLAEADDEPDDLPIEEEDDA